MMLESTVSASSGKEDDYGNDAEFTGPRPHDQRHEIRLYRTRKERREVGLQRSVTPWLRFSGLAELEATQERFRYVDSIDSNSQSEQSLNLQLGLEATPLSWLKGELIIEYDTAPDEFFVEELTMAAEIDSWELVAGKQYLPFGKYFSNFVTRPIVEIGETQEYTVNLSYNHGDRLNLQAAAYQGVARQIDSDDRIDWAFSLDAVLDERLGAGISYLSDLGDAGGRLLEDRGNRFSTKIPGLSGYVIWIGNRFDTTFEVIAAERGFTELDTDRDQPLAWNLELAANISAKFDIALRAEGSRELEGFPKTQYGIALSLSLYPRATMTFELLRGRFTENLANDDNDNPFHSVTTIGAQFSFAF